MSALEDMVGHSVLVITNDGRVIVGELKGFDQTINVVLFDCHERVYSSDAGVEQASLGLQIIRGDNIAMIGEVDIEEDESINHAAIMAEPLKPVVH
eukprot:c11533_g1_i2.p1 GENE.c11533_g1_i2~~c11533_g1_i2.p1  ORF type:complete len:109 (+),score=28.55 c11533_g1_i2:41-328(+)